jgi:hypothetical protein
MLKRSADCLLLSTEESPFVGTRPFVREDQLYFFGRDQESSRLANMVVANNLSVLYGDSGVGKSSLLNAKLPLSLDKLEPDWLIISFAEWQLDCELKLTQIVKTETKISGKESIATSLVSFSVNEDRPILLILDQFEEFFLYRQGGKSSLEINLARLVNRRSNSVKVLLSLRSDGLFLLDKLRANIPNIFESMMLLEPLNEVAAVDCIILPIEAFNRRFPDKAVQVPKRDSKLIEVLVRGSLQTEIMKQLPCRQSVEFDKLQRSDPRIVGPFLQLALRSLWNECILRRRDNQLELEALRQMAGLSTKRVLGNSTYNGSADYTAVGILAQNYVNSILQQFTGSYRDICAIILKRMVLPSGQKVSISFVDVKADLTPKQLKIAKEILDVLCDETKQRLVKRVAPAEVEQDFAFQIIHDALAVPILRWVSEWERTRETQANSKRLFGWLAIVGFGLTLLMLPYYIKRSNAQVKVDQLVNFADRDPRPGFRLPLLLSLSALATDPVLLIDKKPPIKVLVDRLSQSPRDAGSFPAFGFDIKGNKVLWIVHDKLFECDLNSTFECVGSDNTNGISSRSLSDTFGVSTNTLLANMPLRSVGFVEGLDDPVVFVNKGILYYWKDNVQRRIDLGILLYKFMEGKAGFPTIDVIDGKIRVQLANWLTKQTYVVSIKATRNSEQPFEVSNDILSIDWHSDPQADLPPVISPNGSIGVSLTWTKKLPPDVQAVEGCNGFKGDAATGLGNRSYSLTFWSTIEDSNSYSKTLCISPLPRLATGFGFTSDNQDLAFYLDRKITIFMTHDPKLGGKTLRLNTDLVQIAPLGATFSFPPIAATKRSPTEEAEYSLFAWQTESGVRLFRTNNEPSSLVLWLQDAIHTDENHIKDKLLYGGPALINQSPVLANKIEFSDDGKFLVMQVLDFPNSMTRVFIWQIDEMWRNHIIDESHNIEKLKQTTCRIAAFDPSNPPDPGTASFTSYERIEWNQANAQPCGPS